MVKTFPIFFRPKSLNNNVKSVPKFGISKAKSELFISFCWRCGIWTTQPPKSREKSELLPARSISFPNSSRGGLEQLFHPYLIRLYIYPLPQIFLFYLRLDSNSWPLSRVILRKLPRKVPLLWGEMVLHLISSFCYRYKMKNLIRFPIKVGNISDFKRKIRTSYFGSIIWEFR